MYQISLIVVASGPLGNFLTPIDLDALPSH
jgi:hypothetical protein